MAVSAHGICCGTPCTGAAVGKGWFSFPPLQGAGLGGTDPCCYDTHSKTEAVTLFSRGSVYFQIKGTTFACIPQQILSLVFIT